MEPRERLVVALDVDDVDRARVLVRALAPRVGLFKVGLELFTLAGPEFPREIAREGRRVVLDLKLHDIPNTVEGAARRAAALGASLLTVHAQGGRAMVEAAARGAREEAARLRVPAPRILAVTVLTSLDEEDLAAIGLAGPAGAAVERLAALALAAGADGLVASPREVRGLRGRFGAGPILLVPGIRPEDAPPDDQKRTMTPAEAVAAGADYVVVGRPITRARDPAARAAAIVASLDGQGAGP